MHRAAQVLEESGESVTFDGLSSEALSSSSAASPASSVHGSSLFTVDELGAAAGTEGASALSSVVAEFVHAVVEESIAAVVVGGKERVAGSGPESGAAPRRSLDEFIALEQEAAGLLSAAVAASSAASPGGVGGGLPELERWLEEAGAAEYLEGLVDQGFETVGDLMAANLTEDELRECGLDEMRPRKAVLHALRTSGVGAARAGGGSRGDGVAALAEQLLGRLRPLVAELEALVGGLGDGTGARPPLEVDGFSSSLLSALAAPGVPSSPVSIPRELGAEDDDTVNMCTPHGGQPPPPPPIGEEESLLALKTLTTLPGALEEPEEPDDPAELDAAVELEPEPETAPTPTPETMEQAWAALSHGHEPSEVSGHRPAPLVAAPPPAEHRRPATAPAVRSSAWCTTPPATTAVPVRSRPGVADFQKLERSPRVRPATAGGVVPDPAHQFTADLCGNEPPRPGLADRTADFHRRLATKGRRIGRPPPAGDGGGEDGGGTLTAAKQAIRAAVLRWRAASDPHQSPELVLRHLFITEGTTAGHPGKVTEIGLRNLCRARLDVELSPPASESTAVVSFSLPFAAFPRCRLLYFLPDQALGLRSKPSRSSRRTRPPGSTGPGCCFTGSSALRSSASGRPTSNTSCGSRRRPWHRPCRRPRRPGCLDGSGHRRRRPQCRCCGAGKRSTRGWASSIGHQVGRRRSCGFDCASSSWEHRWLGLIGCFDQCNSHPYACGCFDQSNSQPYKHSYTTARRRPHFRPPTTGASDLLSLSSLEARDVKISINLSLRRAFEACRR